MPIYEYRCENGHLFEVMQKMTDEPVTECPEDGAPVQRVFHPIAVHFKGSGFYNTDYGKQKRAGASDGGSSDNNSSNDGKPEAPKKSEKPAEKSTPAASSSSD
jgi:putative FmdB family regulatory protein